MEYSLVDCGGGRRLERFAGVLAARPAPGAAAPAALPPEAWREAELEFTRRDGWRGVAPPDWRVRFGAAVLNLRPGAGGQLGVFPEHAAVADRLDKLLDESPPPAGGWRILNLFAHTGLATLRLAARPGVAALAHVDAAPASMRLARENAAASGLGRAPIRWLVDDVPAFVRREIRRGRTYHLVVADPPAYGRAGKGGEWRLERDLPILLENAAALLAPETGALCLTCHSGGWDGGRLAGAVKAVMPAAARLEGMELELKPESGGRGLAAGFMVLGVAR